MTAHSNPFSERSQDYAAFRPVYPEGLFRWIVSQCTRHEAAWDCGTGTGQAAAALAPFFREVVASDLSAEQIAQALPVANVRYSVQAAESTNLPPASIDLIVVAQALHWFRFPDFWPEVRRVSRDGAFFCAWGYDWFRTDDRLERQLVNPFRAIVQPYWSSGNRILWGGYRDEDVEMPFERVAVPPFSIRMQWTAARLLAYMRTWSAYKRSQADGVAAQQMAELLASSTGVLASPEVFIVETQLRTLAARVHAAGAGGRTAL